MVGAPGSVVKYLLSIGHLIIVLVSSANLKRILLLRMGAQGIEHGTEPWGPQYSLSGLKSGEAPT